MPNFWLGPLLAIVFGVELGWLPVSGRGGLEHLVLPAVSLGAALAAVLARMTRATLADQLREPYVLAARARGVSRARAVLRHAFRNSLIPIVTLAGLQIGAVLTGAVITETIFAWPGIGRLLVQSIGFRDYPMVQGCILLIARHLRRSQSRGRSRVRRSRSADQVSMRNRGRSHRLGRRAGGGRWDRGSCRSIRRHRSWHSGSKAQAGCIGSGSTSWGGTSSRASCRARGSRFLWA